MSARGPGRVVAQLTTCSSLPDTHTRCACHDFMWRTGGDGHARRLRDIQHLEAQASALAAERAALDKAAQVLLDRKFEWSCSDSTRSYMQFA